MEISGQEPPVVQFSQKFWKFRKDFVRGNKEMSGGCVPFRDCSQMKKFVRKNG